LSPRPIVVLGTGGHASVVVDLVRASGRVVEGCAGPDAPVYPSSFCRHLGDDSVLATLDPSTVDAAIGVGSVGDASLRTRIFESAAGRGFHLPPLVHRRATVAGSATLGDGCQIMAGAVVQPFASIGRNVIINTAAVIEHHVTVGDHAHVAPGAVVCGGACVGAGAHIGANAVVLQGVSVGDRAIVGAGAVAARDVPAGSTVKGVPAS
jgi:UDP-perosamine 4-acetyltransferase